MARVPAVVTIKNSLASATATGATHLNPRGSQLPVTFPMDSPLPYSSVGGFKFVSFYVPYIPYRDPAFQVYMPCYHYAFTEDNGPFFYDLEIGIDAKIGGTFFFSDTTPSSNVVFDFRMKMNVSSPVDFYGINVAITAPNTLIVATPAVIISEASYISATETPTLTVNPLDWTPPGLDGSL